MRKSIFAAFAAVFFLAAYSHAQVTVSSPSNGSTVSNPVRVVASASSSRTITAMSIYVDNKQAYHVKASKIDTTLTLASGTRSLVVQSWDSAGTVQKAALKVTVSTSSSSTTTTSTSTSSKKTFSRIEEMSGWESCDKCAGKGGNGPTATYWMKRGVKDPSRDGNAAQFFLGGSTPYSNALWWKQLGHNPAVRNFTYELFYYIKDPAASQALEFDVNQSTDGRKYIFGTECDFKATKQWRIWDTEYGKWRTTGVACTVPKAYTWQHLVFEFQRTSDKKTRFIAITVNGKRHYLNRYYNSRASSAREVNVAFQMDGNGQMKDYSTWVDQIKLTYW